MSNSIKIANSNEPEFAVFCIENIAIRLGKNGEDIYRALAVSQTTKYLIPLNFTLII